MTSKPAISCLAALPRCLYQPYERFEHDPGGQESGSNYLAVRRERGSLQHYAGDLVKLKKKKQQTSSLLKEEASNKKKAGSGRGRVAVYEQPQLAQSNERLSSKLESLILIVF